MSWKIKKNLENRLEAEQNAVVKKRGGRLSVALVYPNEYRVGMGNLAVHSLYRSLNASDEIMCERAFLPSSSEMNEHIRTDTPVLTLESQTPLSDFDVIAFTVSFENDLLNLIPILSISKIPHRACDRKKGHPLVIAGGAVISLNQNCGYDIFDAQFLGEFEAFEHELIDLLSRLPSKDEIISELKNIGGILLGENYAKKRSEVKKRFLDDINGFKTQTEIYSPTAMFGNMHLIEVQRGCPRSCKFCAAPAIYSPFRFRSAEAVIKMVEDGIVHRKKFGLIGSDILSHPEFVQIAEAIHSRGATFSPSSIRVSAINEAKAKLLAKSSHRSIALGIEAGSEKLRSSIGKKIPAKQIEEALEILAREGISAARLYFMLGLPNETEADVAEIAEVAKFAKAILSKNSPKGKGLQEIEVTLSAFVPKPLTKFSGEEFCGGDYFKKAANIVKQALSREKGVKVSHDSILVAETEAYIANSGRECVNFLESANENGLRKALSEIKK